MFIKLFTIYVLIVFILPILLMIFKVYFKYKVKELQGKRINDENRRKIVEKRNLKKDAKIIYEKEYKPYYEKTRDLFNQLMKNGSLSREEILEFKLLLNKCLGSYTHEYKNKKVFKFENDCHEIYTKLKSYNLDVNDWNILYEYLKNH